MLAWLAARGGRRALALLALAVTLGGVSTASAAAALPDPIPLEVTRAFADARRVYIEGDTARIDEARLRALVPELNKPIVNTRVLDRQLAAAGEAAGVPIRAQYELGYGHGYDIRVRIESAPGGGSGAVSPDTAASTPAGHPSEAEAQARAAAATDATAPVPPDGEAEPSAPEPSFRLERLTVAATGGVPTDQPDLTARLARYEGQNVTMSDLNAAVTDVTRYYRGKGYPAATAYLPPQQSKDGAIQINLEPGRYGKIHIENESRLHDSAVEGLAARMKPGEIIRTKDIETAIYNVMDQGGVKAAGLLNPGSQQGETDVTLRVENTKRDSYVLYAENHGSRSSGRYRYGFSANWYEMLGVGDHLAAYGLISNNKQHNWGLRYDILTGHSGTRLGLGISRTDYELGSHLSSWGAVGEANILTFYGTTPLWKTSTGGLGFSYGYTFQKLTDEMRTVDYIVKKHTHSVYLGVNGFQNTGKTTISYDLTATVGHLAGDSARIGDIPLEVGAAGNYTKGVLNTSLLQKFDDNFDILLKFQGQMAGTDLDSSERIYLGGANGVRAYPQGEGSGDQGWQATAELSWHTKVPGLTLSTYLDLGHVKYTHSGNLPGGTTLKGWGIGISYRRPGDFFLRLDYARRIGLAPDATDDAHAKGRVWFMVGKVF